MRYLLWIPVLTLIACGPPTSDRRGNRNPPPADAGSCEGIPCGGGCCAEGLVCVDDRCEACTPSCDGLECGDDGCGGSCGTCEAGFCNAGICDLSCEPDCEGLDCGDDGCGGSCGSCSGNETCNDFGRCVSTCTPNCSGRSCGDDGCGGSCGSCSGNQTCNASGQCVSTCTPNCSGRSCGDDGCGGSCGACSGNQTCNASGQCVSTCTPNCSGRSCGDDGCGGSCGACSGNQTCNASGQCVGQPTGAKWTPLSGTLPVAFGSSTWDAQRGRTLVYGGESNSGACRSPGSTTKCVHSEAVYELETNGVWTKNQPGYRPLGRVAPAFVWDSSTQSAKVHGGLVSDILFGTIVSNHFWEWRPSEATWVELSATNRPFHAGHAVAQKSPGHLLFFGGLASSGQGSTYSSASFEYLSGAFLSMSPANPPSARAEFAFAWSPEQQRLYIFGGSNSNGASLDETWYLDATGWHQLTGPGPSARYGARMVWDSAGQRALLYGGCLDDVTSDELWQLANGTWTQLTVTGDRASGRCQHQFERASGGGFVVAGGFTFDETSITDTHDSWRLTFGP